MFRGWPFLFVLALRKKKKPFLIDYCLTTTTKLRFIYHSCLSYVVLFFRFFFRLNIITASRDKIHYLSFGHPRHTERCPMIRPQWHFQWSALFFFLWRSCCGEQNAFAETENGFYFETRFGRNAARWPYFMEGRRSGHGKLNCFFFFFGSLPKNWLKQLKTSSFCHHQLDKNAGPADCGFVKQHPNDLKWRLMQ